MAKKFFVTTPIYYANWLPHIGHSYSSFIADFYARYKRLFWYEVKFSTWTDENSQKIVQKAQELWKDVMDYLNEIDIERRRTRDDLNISYTDYIRTTEERHKIFVQKILKKVHEKDLHKPENERDIYKWQYSWLYCVGCESFKYERDLVKNDKWELVCPDHQKKPDEIKENNRFFRLKSYESELKNFYKTNPDFVVPQHRFNEIISFVDMGLEDFSISRETNKFGIPLPFDDQQVTYVWYDALLNYVTVCQEDETNNFRDEWTQILHILWKDIVKFHATYRPAMLMSAWLRLPDKEVVTWYFTVDGQKMSKSIWNVIDPVQLAKDYDRDLIVFYLLYDVHIGWDWDFSRERFKNMYDSMLIWWWGNLVNRVTSLCKKYSIKNWNIETLKHWKIKELFVSENNLLKYFDEGFDVGDFEKKYLDGGNLKQYLEEWYQLVQYANEYISKAEPWKKYKDENTKDEAISDLKFLLYFVKNIALLSAPFLVNWFKKIQKILWNQEISSIDIDSKNALDLDQFKKVFDMKNFDVDLNIEVIYQKKLEE